MTDHVCELHGPYPFSDSTEAPSYCLGCLLAKDRAQDRAQSAFDALWMPWDAWMRQSGVRERYRTRSVANWRPVNGAQEKAQKVIRAYCERIDRVARDGRGLTLLGPPGVGKTHLCYGVIAEAHKAGIRARYEVWADVLARLKASFDDRESRDRNLIGGLKRVPLLVLDEIGVREGSDFDQAQLFDLIDERYSEQRPTLIATNLTEASLDSIGERTADRLREANVLVHIPGQSRRAEVARDSSLIDAPLAFPEPEPPALTHRVAMNGAWVDKPLAIRRPVRP